MRKIVNIVSLFFILAMLGTACSPQIRFSSKNISVNKKISKAQNKNISQSKEIKSSNSFKNYTAIIQRTASTLDSKRKDLILSAEEWLGTPYLYGGEDKSGTDCSGFVMKVFDKAGISLPRTAARQYEFGKNITGSELIPGDLIFFNRKNGIGHVGIYIGGEQFIHASSSRGVVLQNLSDSYYKRTLAGFKRVIKAKS